MDLGRGTVEVVQQLTIESGPPLLKDLRTEASHRVLAVGAYPQRRVERLGTRQGGPRRGRAVRIDVDDGAWATVKREAVRRRLWLVWCLGDLIRIEVGDLVVGEVTGTPTSRRRRSPGEGEPAPRRRFVRVEVYYDLWLDLRAGALDAGVTVGRYVGELAEAVAHEAGWRAAARGK